LLLLSPLSSLLSPLSYPHESTSASRRRDPPDATASQLLALALQVRSRLKIRMEQIKQMKRN
jgi:hypothetical protein